MISLGFTLKLLPIVASPKKTSNAVGSGFNEANTISYFHRLIDWLDMGAIFLIYFE